jgi:DNA (cytosine-5)-methyltransferase 1
MIADDLFAGAGGWDLAAAKLGIHARGVENMPAARATREAAGLETIHDDVWTFAPDGSASGLIASPPCQTFSAAGKGNGRAALDEVRRAIGNGAYKSLARLRGLGMYVGDDRTALVLTPLHFALTGGYEWLAWEQVPTVLPVWEACADELREHGWNVWTGLLYAEQYGVPQTRKRAFLLASRNGVVLPPEPTHSRYYSRDPGKLDMGVKPWVSMAEALGWGLQERPAPTVTGGGTETGGAEPIAKLARYTSRPDWLSSPSGITGPVVRSVNHPAATVTGNHYIFTREEWEHRNPDRPLPDWAFKRPSTTIVGSFRPDIISGPGYRTTTSRQNAEGSVRVTVSEAGILQSFPADYPWNGGPKDSEGKKFLQAGNAVPPGLALHALMAATASVDSEVAA